MVMSTGAGAADLHASKAPDDKAAPRISGYIGFYAGASWADAFDNIATSCEPSDTASVTGAVGAANLWLADRMSLQVTAQTERASAFQLGPVCGQEGSRAGHVIGAHLAWRDPSSHSLGVFAAATKSNNWYIDSTHTGALGGLEAQRYFGSTTLYGQVGFGGQSSDPDFMLDDYWFARGVVRHFINPNHRISGEVSFAAGTDDTDGESLEIWGWGVGLERRHEGTPFSGSLEYAGDLISGFRGTSVQHSFLFGLKIHFGTQTLLYDDRYGATFDLPRFYRAMPGSCWGSCADRAGAVHLI